MDYQNYQCFDYQDYQGYQEYATPGVAYKPTYLQYTDYDWGYNPYYGEQYQQGYDSYSYHTESMDHSNLTYDPPLQNTELSLQELIEQMNANTLQFQQNFNSSCQKNVEPSLEDLVKQLDASNIQCQQNVSASIQELKITVEQLSISVNHIQSQPQIPCQPFINQEENISDLRNGKELQENEIIEYDSYTTPPLYPPHLTTVQETSSPLVEDHTVLSIKNK